MERRARREPRRSRRATDETSAPPGETPPTAGGPSTPREGRLKPRFPRWPAILVAILALAVLAAGSWLYVDQTRDAKRDAEQDLLAIGHLKVQQIVEWRAERLADGAHIMAHPETGRLLARWLEEGTPTSRDELMLLLESLRVRPEYVDIRLVDAAGRVLLSLTGQMGTIGTETAEALSVALAERRPVLTDLHFGDGTIIHVDVIAPLFAAGPGEGRPVGAVVLSESASSFLFPLIQTWPTASRSGETLLVRRDGDQVLYLNDLRHQPGAALKLRLPLTRTELPAVQAVLGATGVVEGADYSGVPVYAVVEPVPDSPWFMVAKIARSEVQSAAKERAVPLLVASLVLVVAMVGVAGTTWQRTLKKRYEEAYQSELRRQALLERFQYLVRQANDGILLADEELRIVEANERALQLYGYARDELVGRSLSDLVSASDAAAWAQAMASLAESEGYVAEATHRRKNGEEFPVEVSARRFLLDDVPHVQVIVRVISERKRAEEERKRLEQQFQHSQRLESLGRLAGGIAHDFNNVLMAVLGHAELALAELPPSSRAREDLQEIVNASHRAAELCRQMMAYSGRGHVQEEAVDLVELVGGMVHLLSSVISKKVLLNLHLEKNLPPLLGDPSQIDQVIMNLVLNASEAIGERSGVITISAGAMECSREYLRSAYLDEDLPEGLYVTLEVSDTGSGMSKETLARLFEPFFSTKAGGRGLGLAAVLGIVRAHKGAIKVYSEPGKGTTFKLLFPAAPGRQAAGGNQAQAATEWKGSGTILLVDDEETIRALGKRMLETLGFEVLVAADGRQALEVYRGHQKKVVLVLLDLTMPHMNGEETFRELRRLDPGVRVILSSGYLENDVATRFAGKGLAGFIQKPYTLTALTERLKAVLSPS
jgi:PAS domain S-box-containing protein